MNAHSRFALLLLSTALSLPTLISCQVSPPPTRPYYQGQGYYPPASSYNNLQPYSNWDNSQASGQPRYSRDDDYRRDNYGYGYDNRQDTYRNKRNNPTETPQQQQYRIQAEAQQQRLQAEVEKQRLLGEYQQQKAIGEAEQQRLQAEFQQQQQRMQVEAEQQRLQAEGQQQIQRAQAEALQQQQTMQVQAEQQRQQAEFQQQKAIAEAEQQKQQAEYQRVKAEKHAKEVEECKAAGLPDCDKL
ncbi:MAG: hypothetical protein CG439_2294 [Methylococcaceae bacterium NSP1-2]|nr:hypothetical protein [Methylococcaceae bacterium]OYV15983.1 MAG: hypothetical protein CG439_2294 [Methylococcaceae bacterium NSP1-2]